MELMKEQKEIINYTWDNYRLIDNIILSLSSIGLHVEPTEDMTYGVHNLYKIMDNSVITIMKVLNIPESKTEDLCNILNEELSNYFDYDEISEEALNKIIQLSEDY